MKTNKINLEKKLNHEKGIFKEFFALRKILQSFPRTLITIDYIDGERATILFRFSNGAVLTAHDAMGTETILDGVDTCERMSWLARIASSASRNGKKCKVYAPTSSTVDGINYREMVKADNRAKELHNFRLANDKDYYLECLKAENDKRAKRAKIATQRANDSMLAISAIETAKKQDAVKAEEEKTQAMIDSVYAVA